MFLGPFRLPGEAQKIDRMMQSFSKRLFEHSRGPMKHSDVGCCCAHKCSHARAYMHMLTHRHVCSHMTYNAHDACMCSCAQVLVVTPMYVGDEAAGQVCAGILGDHA